MYVCVCVCVCVGGWVCVRVFPKFKNTSHGLTKLEAQHHWLVRKVLVDGGVALERHFLVRTIVLVDVELAGDDILAFELGFERRAGRELVE